MFRITEIERLFRQTAIPYRFFVQRVHADDRRRKTGPNYDRGPHAPRFAQPDNAVFGLDFDDGVFDPLDHAFGKMARTGYRYGHGVGADLADTHVFFRYRRTIDVSSRRRVAPRSAARLYPASPPGFPC